MKRMLLMLLALLLALPCPVVCEETAEASVTTVRLNVSVTDSNRYVLRVITLPTAADTCATVTAFAENFTVTDSD